MEKHDPLVAMARNDGLEWAAKWAENSARLSGETEPRLVEFARNIAESIRAAKEEINVQRFEDAIRNDPYMKPEQKAAWLGLAGNNKSISLLAAALDYKGKTVAICAETITDLKDVWDALMTEDILNEEKVDRVLITGDLAEPTATLKSGD